MVGLPVVLDSGSGAEELENVGKMSQLFPGSAGGVRGTPGEDGLHPKKSAGGNIWNSP